MRVAARDQLPRGDPGHTWDSTLAVHPGNQEAGAGRWLRRTTHLGQWAHQAPGRLSSSGLGRAQHASPTESVPLWRTWEPKPEQPRPGKCTQARMRFGQFPCRTTWSLSSVDRESTCALSWGKPSVGHTLSTPHTHQRCLSAVSFPPHNTTEQVSLNSDRLLPLVSGQKLDTEETFQQRKAK